MVLARVHMTTVLYMSRVIGGAGVVLLVIVADTRVVMLVVTCWSGAGAGMGGVVW